LNYYKLYHHNQQTHNNIILQSIAMTDIDKHITEVHKHLEEIGSVVICGVVFNQLGNLYKKGLGVKIDIDKAIEYYTKSYNLEYEPAFDNIIDIYDNSSYHRLHKTLKFYEFVKSGYERKYKSSFKKWYSILYNDQKFTEASEVILEAKKAGIDITKFDHHEIMVLLAEINESNAEMMNVVKSAVAIGKCDASVEKEILFENSLLNNESKDDETKDEVD
jgi:TPR repeat protein